jgi:hypothetical protein
MKTIQEDRIRGYFLNAAAAIQHGCLTPFSRVNAVVYLDQCD